MHVLELMAQLPLAVWGALASVLATGTGVGYLVARGRKTGPAGLAVAQGKPLAHAGSSGRELEGVAWTLRRNLAQHQANISAFRQRLDHLEAAQRHAAWQAICREAEELLVPALELAGRIGAAFDQLRQPPTDVPAAREVCRDRLTGLGNRRVLDQSLTQQLALHGRYKHAFCVAVFDIDHLGRINEQQGIAQGDKFLRQLAGSLADSVRDTDVAVRYAGAALLVVMPNTDLEGACIFSERWRSRVAGRIALTVSGGVTEALDGDTPDSLLARAEVALYQAKSSGRNRVCRHDGEDVELVPEHAAASAAY